MSHNVSSGGSGAWPVAVSLLARWLDRRERIDELIDGLPPGLSAADRARCQHLVFGVVRHFGRLDAALGRLIAHPPRFPTRAVLLMAGFELIEATGGAEPGLVAKIVHHAVEQAKTVASPAEARLVNAVVRKLAGILTAAVPPKLAPAEALAEYFSHPDWLVRRWLVEFGADGTRRLLEWNQCPAKVYARWRGAGSRPDFLQPTPWPGFLEVPSGQWAQVEPLLKGGQIYLQDPATRLAVELLAPQPGEAVLDACAAPGGKSLLIADAMKSGRLVALDLPGPRIARLKENLARAHGVEVALVQGDLLGPAGALLREHRLPEHFPAVLVDVPCSNTGVMRHRVDVKWRLDPRDIDKHARQQLTLLQAAARLVAPGGRIVYSTCSIDAEENEHVVRGFLSSRAGAAFQLEASAVSLPWETGHDGAAAYRLRRGGA
ncbi:MAG: RsmB/NOP family class I SAM-dependent RNA methyltransferase [Verrucomicrobia bacterium]|nr:RsmB/NOP family class I SAM-dependent RNA methyltransferase [Verrucomicrobiota bacterium]